jgi:hypothetical protein
MPIVTLRREWHWSRPRSAGQRASVIHRDHHSWVPIYEPVEALSVTVSKRQQTVLGHRLLHLPLVEIEYLGDVPHALADERSQRHSDEPVLVWDTSCLRFGVAARTVLPGVQYLAFVSLENRNA